MSVSDVCVLFGLDSNGERNSNLTALDLGIRGVLKPRSHGVCACLALALGDSASPERTFADFSTDLTKARVRKVIRLIYKARSEASAQQCLTASGRLSVG